MRNFLLLLLVSFCCMAHAQNQPSPKKTGVKFSFPATLTSKDYREGVLIVKFKPVAASGNKTQASALAPQIKLSGAQVLSVTRKFGGPAASNITVSKAEADNGLDRIYEVKFSGGKIEDLIDQLLTDPRVEYAEPDYVYRANYSPNDPRFAAGNQAYLNVVKAPQAWDLVRNSSGVIIGIVDSGSELTHEDLAANIFTNTSDPVNGLDDDNDGYIDNFAGWDLVGATAGNIKEDNDPNVKMASADHGVHVSGIAGAVTDNGKGVSSISFNPKLLVVKCAADNDGESIYRGYDGIKYAVDHGAMVINCSWGGPGGGSYGLDIINYALSKGRLIVAAAGNDNTSVPDYPSAYPGVLAVANTDNSDVKSASSNYGPHVAISAPGTSILNTRYNNQYGTISGTSMSSPMVAAAAALVKSYNPGLTMQQVGERLRVTSDNIDGNNSRFIGQLGKGRLNVYRALTESPPSVRNQKTTLVDNGTGSIPAGETLTVYFDLKNFLSPVTGLSVKLSSTDPNVTITASDQTVASLATNGTATRVGPFAVFIKPTTPDNTPVIFRLDYAGNSGSYTDNEYFTLNTNLDYLNVQVNKAWTTMTSNGRVGYSKILSNGLGFIYNNQNLLYEASLMIGTGANKLSDNTRTSSNTANEHFVKKVRVNRITNPDAAFEGRSEFDDSGSPNPLNVYVKHKAVAFSAAPDDKYVLVEYEVFNTTTTDLAGAYIGLYTDWDIDDGTTDVTKYDATNRLAYVFKKTGTFPFAGVKLLTNKVSPAYYPLSYMVSNDPLVDDSFTAAEKFTALSSGIKATSLGESSANGYDVSFVSGYGPVNIPAKGSVKVAFAFIGGDNLADLQASATAAQAKYLSITPDEPVLPAGLVVNQNFPNPVTEKTTIEFSIPQSGQVTVALYDLMGRKVKTYLNEFIGPGFHTVNVNSFDLQNGLYVYKVHFRGEEKALKMIVAK